jgi:hypothetical protein
LIIKKLEVDSKNLEELEEIRKQLMFNKPDYSHIAKESKVAIKITSEEAAAIFYAYDRGFDALDDESKRQLDVVIGKLKYELWS